MPWCICGGQGTICGDWFSPSFHHIGPREGTRVVNLGTKYLYPLSHLAELLGNLSFLCVKNIPNPFYWLFGGFSSSSAIDILWWCGTKKPFPKCNCPLHPPTTPALLPRTSQAPVTMVLLFPQVSSSAFTQKYEHVGLSFCAVNKMPRSSIRVITNGKFSFFYVQIFIDYKQHICLSVDTQVKSLS